MATTTPAGVRAAHAKHGGGTHGSAPDGAPMSHRQIMEALTGLLLGMFVAILSSTIVSNALPDIIKDLGGGQSAYTWVVTASLLAMTASTPLWGKLADLFSKKLLIQFALVIFVLGSAAAGLSQNAGMLIAFRAVQGVGMGGLSALAQIILAAMISPRERGRYNGYLGATFATAMVGGPLIGGVITDTSWLGWRWCFYVGVPFAVVALIVLQRTLHLPVVKRKAKVDWTGAFFITAAVCLLLVWVTFAGDKYDWVSWQTYAMIGGTVALLGIFVLVESKASEPIIPLRLFRNRTITLASLASLFVGVAMFAGTIFFSQYFQLARDKSPTMSGVMTIPMIGGLFVASTVSGQVITRTGTLEGLAARRRCAGDGRSRSAGHPALRHPLLARRRLHGAARPRRRHDDAEPGALHPEPGLPRRPRRRQLGGHLLPVPRRRDRRLRAGRGPQPPDHRPPQGRPGDHRPEVRGGDSPVPPPTPSPTWTCCPRRCARSSRARTATASATSSSTPPRSPCSRSSSPSSSRRSRCGPRARWRRPRRRRRCLRPTPVADAVVRAAPTVATVAVDAAGRSQPVRGGIPVRGHVRGAESAPVPQAAVTLISLTGRQLGRAVAQGDGAYALDAPGTGSYVLIASADGFQPQASTVVVNGEPVAYDILLSGTSGLGGHGARRRGPGCPSRTRW